jgi:hypothetical protein
LLIHLSIPNINKKSSIPIVAFLAFKLALISANQEASDLFGEELSITIIFEPLKNQVMMVEEQYSNN